MRLAFGEKAILKRLGPAAIAGACQGRDEPPRRTAAIHVFGSRVPTDDNPSYSRHCSLLEALGAIREQAP
jgi:hypothetical protein